MSDSIQQTLTFRVSPHELYEALMDSGQHAAFSHAAAEISRAVGGAIMAYDGYISGKNIELIPDQLIVQDWRAVDWPENQFSRVRFEFSPVPEGTHLDFTHTGLPKGTREEFAQGWIDNYWDPLKTYLEK